MTKEQMLGLKVGDKVTCDKSFRGYPQKDWIGKVVSSGKGNLGIEWEKSFNKGHTCGSLGLENHCRWYGFFGNDYQESDSINILSMYKKNIQLEFEF